MTLDDTSNAAIAAYIKDRHISRGLGTREEPCSIAAINLALTGELTDKIPDCMSEVIGAWIIRIQDGMPDDMRNGAEWRALLPLAAGTGREFEVERLTIIISRLRETVLPTLNAAPSNVAALAADYAAEASARAAWAAGAAAWAARAAAVYAEVASNAVYAEAASNAVYAEADAGYAAAWAEAWAKFNPPALLQQLIEVGNIGGTK
jgi:hypothetical protein